jgi:hypothetical protein
VSRPADRALLRAHGIDAPVALDRESVERFNPAQPRAEAATDLTAAEVEALRRGGLDAEPHDEGGPDDPLARAAAEFDALVAASPPVEAVARRLGLPPARVRRLIERRRLYGVRLASGWRVPELQIDGDRLLPGLGEVVAKLDPALHPLTVHRWFTATCQDLDAGEGRPLSPCEWLRAGRPAATVAGLAAGL